MKNNYVTRTWLGIVLRTTLILTLAWPLKLVIAAPTNKESTGKPVTHSKVSLEMAYHTISIDGDMSEWGSDELMQADGPYTLYLTWDATNLYLGLTGATLGDTVGQDKSFFVCFDTNLLAGSGAGSDGYGNVNFNTTYFAPEYCYYFAGGAGWYEWSTWNGASWSWNGWRNDGTYYHWPGNPAPLPGSELTIIRSEIGNPTSVGVAAWLTPEANPAGPGVNIEASWPTPNSTGTTPTFAHFYHFPSLTNGIAPNRSVLANHLVINEFRPKGTEWVEIYNPTDSPVSLQNWYADDVPCGSGTSLIGAVNLAPGAYYVINANQPGDNFDLDNSGDHVYLCNNSGNEVDHVAYGISGGAAVSHFQSPTDNATARTPNGTDSGDDARDWNIATTPTSGSINKAPVVLLGNSLIINEAEFGGANTPSRVELYNPTANPVSLTNWRFTDGDAAPIPITTDPSAVIVPGGYYVFSYQDQGSSGIGSSDVAYLFTPDGIRVDQLGWNGHFLVESAQRIGNGSGPNDGFNWATSGGDVSLFDLPETFGYSNTQPDLQIAKIAPVLAEPGEVIEYTIWVTNSRISSVATGLIITDAIPLSTTYAYGGNLYANGIITFTTPTTVAYGAPISVTFGVTVNALSGQIITNALYGVTADDLTAPVMGTPVTTYVSALDLEVSKTAPLFAGAGEPIIYTIDIIHRGSVSAQGVMITDTLPANVTYLGDTSGYTPANPSPGVYVWSIGEIYTGTTFSFQITATVDSGAPLGTTLINSAKATTTTPGDIPINNQDQASTWVIIPIHDIQGAAHRSPMEGNTINPTGGIVTAIRSNGFYLQDPVADDNEATSEAIFIYTGSAPGQAIGNAVLVAGTVTEYRPGDPLGSNLSATEIQNPTITLLSTGNSLPAPIVIGQGGRIPPAQIISDDASNGNVEDPATPFDPQNDGIDFYESLEFMLVQVNNAMAVGPTNYYGEIPVVGDLGSNASLITPRGGIVIQEGDFNPERILVDDTLIGNEPQVRTGSLFNAPIIGVLDYSFGNFKLYNTIPLNVTINDLITETLAFTRTDEQITVATFNVENLDPNPNDGDDDTAKFIALAFEIVNNLDSPDILALEEIQDNSGTVDDGVVDASLTYQTLINAILAAGGPTYEYRQISPENNQDGGAPGGNIRMAFLFRTDRGLTFIDRPGGDATTPVQVNLGATGVELSLSPGRIDPQNTAFLDSRKPLAGEFMFNGYKIIVIANHLNSKGGDDPLFGRYQPPILYSEQQRLAQAAVIHAFVQEILALDPSAHIIVLGDLNDFQFSAPIQVLKGDALLNLTDTLSPEERYSYIYDGNSQALEHILVTPGLLNVSDYDVVHLHAEYLPAERASDHDPAVARFTLPTAQMTISKSVTPANDLPLGGVVTYTIALSNPSSAYLYGIAMTDVLPVEVTFGGWVQQNGAVESGGMITWNGALSSGQSLTFVFTAAAGTDPAYYGQTILNRAIFTSENDGSGMAEAAFSFIGAPALNIQKTVSLTNDPALPGDVVTYTIIVNNTGDSAATNVHITDTLPAGLIGQGVDLTVTIGAGQAHVIVFTATVAPDVAPGSTIVNTAYYTYALGNGSASVSFDVAGLPALNKLFLPTILKH